MLTAHLGLLVGESDQEFDILEAYLTGHIGKFYLEEMEIDVDSNL